jgi:hypothetical protein
MQGSHGPMVCRLAYPGGLEVAGGGALLGIQATRLRQKKLWGNVTCITHRI